MWIEKARITASVLAVLAVTPWEGVGQEKGEEQKAEIVEVRKIWDRAPHNAFTDLIRFNGKWVCVFREGKGHVSPDGCLRVIVSKDGEAFESAALMKREGADLRDAKITVTPDGRLMLGGAAALHQPSERRHQSLVWFSKDGRTWTEGHEAADPDFWLWRVTWHEGTAYGIGYATGGQRGLRLYRSEDGMAYEILVDRLFDRGYPNETSLVFLEDGVCLCLLRRDGAEPTAQLGKAAPPYRTWTWRDLGMRLGGPHMIRIPDGRFLAAGRLYDGQTRTSLLWLDPSAGTIEEFLALPSGGDTSYPGLVFHDGLLWVSYYSSHEEKTSIYLAKVKLPSE
jgi:hypothetical protein